MAYIVPADFRPETTASWCSGLVLPADQASSGDLTIAIAAISQRIEEKTGDYFTKQTLVLEHDVTPRNTGDEGRRLYLQRRCTAVTTVKLRDYTGTLGAAQTASLYRLHSSLDTAGAVQLGELDWLDLVPLSAGLTGLSVTNPWAWPVGPQTVQVTGDFGWTVTPGDIKRATALYVWDLFFRQAGDLGRARAFSRGDARIELADGVPEADEILKDYMRGAPVMIG
jgi:hypothetical protein